MPLVVPYERGKATDSPLRPSVAYVVPRFPHRTCVLHTPAAPFYAVARRPTPRSVISLIPRPPAVTRGMLRLPLADECLQHRPQTPVDRRCDANIACPTPYARDASPALSGKQSLHAVAWGFVTRLWPPTMQAPLTPQPESTHAPRLAVIALASQPPALDHVIGPSAAP